MTRNILFFLFLIICGLIPISGYSLWTDEAWTITEYAIQPDFKSLINSIVKSIGGDSQFPGYNIYIWLWVKLFGISELSVRYSNLPFYYISLLFCIIYLPRNRNFKIWFLLLICLNPLIWFYLNESRYIISIFSFSLISLISLIHYFEGDEKNKKLSIQVLFSSLILGTAFMMLYIFYLIPLFFILLYYLKMKSRTLLGFIKQWKVHILILLITFLILGFYYLNTLLNGAGGTRLEPGFNNMVFVFYDFLGYSGIGPPRNILRQNPIIQFNSVYFWGIVIFSLNYLISLGFIIKNFNVKHLYLLFGFLGLTIGLLIFYIFAKSFDFKFLSRHLIFFYPIFLFYSFSLFYENVLNKYKIFSIVLIFTFFSSLLYSNFNIRFNADYQKENIKTASEIAVEESNELKIMWIADRHGFEYYTFLRKRNENNFKKNNIVFIPPHTEMQILKYIKPYFFTEKYFIVISNRKDYDKIIQNFLLSNSYNIFYQDKDFTMYK